MGGKAKPARWRVHPNGKPRDEVRAMRNLEQHRWDAYMDALSRGASAETIRKRWEKYVAAREACARARKRRAA